MLLKLPWVWEGGCYLTAASLRKTFSLIFFIMSQISQEHRREVDDYHFISKCSENYLSDTRVTKVYLSVITGGLGMYGRNAAFENYRPKIKNR